MKITLIKALVSVIVSHDIISICLGYIENTTISIYLNILGL